MAGLERDLRRARPEPRSHFVESLATEIRGRGRSHSPLRVALAGGLTVVLFTALAAVGGIGYAAAAPAKAVQAVVHAVAGDSGVGVVRQSPAQDQYVKCNSGRGNLSETSSGPRSTDSATLINPHLGNTALGPGELPTDDCDPGNSGAVNRGGD